jgi:hypothetical protein
MEAEAEAGVKGLEPKESFVNQMIMTRIINVPLMRI